VLDHIVVVTSDLGADATWLAEQTGIRGHYGGNNPVNGTRNMLFPLADAAYLELLAADEERPESTERPLPLGLDHLTGREIAAWAVRVPDFDAAITRARADGVPLGSVARMSRRRPDGQELHWRMTYPPDRETDRLCPFLIDWGTAEHPTTGLDMAQPLDIADFTALTPEPGEVESWLTSLGLRDDVRVAEAARPGFQLEVRGPSGAVVLRGTLGS
jgi:catechol 2,3-dioxygenase-like lactoylglutathione lyase family enzyme